jgi:glycosyltransferase involved in cell wall biosynthesis
MILSILICSIPKRKMMLSFLTKELLRQIGQLEVQFIADSSMDITTGAKRNSLIQKASGKYVTFIDDDDTIAKDYVSQILNALKSEPDAVGFKGWITTNGRDKREWKISKDFPYEQKGRTYLRYNNHLSPIKREIALQIGYPDTTYGEDYDYATRLKESGLIQTEVFIDKHLYNYNYRTKK